VLRGCREQKMKDLTFDLCSEAHKHLAKVVSVLNFSISISFNFKYFELFYMCAINNVDHLINYEGQLSLFI